jgi:hypothetical protein
MIRQTDSSLLDEWEALADPDADERLVELEGLHAHGGTRPSRPITANEKAFRVMVRNALFRRIELASRDRVEDLAALEQSVADLTDPPGEVVMDEAAWDDALGAYWEEHASIGTDGDARGPQLLHLEKQAGLWLARQTVADPEANHDWVIEARVDLSASDEAGEPVVLATSMRRL